MDQPSRICFHNVLINDALYSFEVIKYKDTKNQTLRQRGRRRQLLRHILCSRTKNSNVMLQRD